MDTDFLYSTWKIELPYKMAQSSGWDQKNPLNIPPFWLKHTTQPPVEWSEWIVGLLMAIFAIENIDVQFSLQNRPKTPIQPPSPKLEEAIGHETQTQRHDRE